MRSTSLDTERVWNSLFLYWLLQDTEERQTNLELDHDARSHAERLKPALRACNLRMVGPGQPQWNHACNLCCAITNSEGGGRGTL